MKDKDNKRKKARRLERLANKLKDELAGGSMKTKKEKKQLKVFKIISLIVQKILLQDAGRIGRPDALKSFAEKDLPDDETVIVSFTFGHQCKAKDAAEFMSLMGSLEAQAERKGLGIIVSPSNLAELVKDLVASGFNPAVHLGIDGLLKIDNLQDLIDHGSDLKKLSDLIPIDEIKGISDNEENEEDLTSLNPIEGRDHEKQDKAKDKESSHSKTMDGD